MTIKEANDTMKAVANKLYVSEHQNGYNLETRNPHCRKYYGTRGAFKPCYSFTSPFVKNGKGEVSKAAYLNELEYLTNKFTENDVFGYKEFKVCLGDSTSIQTLRYSAFIIYEDRNEYRLSDEAYRYVLAAKAIASRIDN